MPIVHETLYFSLILVFGILLFSFRVNWKETIKSTRNIFLILFLLQLFFIVAHSYVFDWKIFEIDEKKSWFLEQYFFATAFSLLGILITSADSFSDKTPDYFFAILGASALHVVIGYLDILYMLIFFFDAFDVEKVRFFPRVGSQYLSLSCLGGIFSSYLILKRTKENFYKFTLILLIFACVLLICLMQNLETILSAFFAVCIFYFLRKREKFSISLKKVVNYSFLKKVILILLVTSSFWVIAKETRLTSVYHSVNLAFDSVFENKTIMGYRAHMESEFWVITPTSENFPVKEDYRDRIYVDQSIFLRSAWLLSAINSVITHPMGRNDEIFQMDGHIVNLSYNFGFLPGLFLMGFFIFFLYKIKNFLQRTKIDLDFYVLLVVSCICFLRLIFGGFYNSGFYHSLYCQH